MRVWGRLVGDILLVGLQIAQAFFEAFEFEVEFVDLARELGDEGRELIGFVVGESCGLFDAVESVGEFLVVGVDWSCLGLGFCCGSAGVLGSPSDSSRVGCRLGLPLLCSPHEYMPR